MSDRTRTPGPRKGLYFLPPSSATTSARPPRYSESRRAAGSTPPHGKRKRPTGNTTARTATARRATTPEPPAGRARRQAPPTERAGRTAPRAGRSAPAAAAKRHPARKNVKRRVVAPKILRSPKPSRFGLGQARHRLRLVAMVVLVVLAAVLTKVAKLQTSDGERLRAEGASMWSRTFTLPADRGSIFDRNGEELAVSVPAVSISVNPKLIDDADEIVGILTQLLRLDDAEAAKLRDKIVAKDSGFVYVRRQVNPAIGDQLRSMKLAGVNVDDEDRRILPGGSTGKSVIGLTDIDGIGIGGLELQYGGGEAGVEAGYSDILAGTPGSATREVTHDGGSIAGTEQVLSAPVPGADIVLTIDRSIQFALEQALIDQVTAVSAKAGQAIVMDTDTGDVLAMASVQRDSETGQVVVTSRNSAAVDAYEPGSVAKVITMAAALNEDCVKPSTSFTVPWRITRDLVLSDSHQHPDEEMTVQKILVESSNVGTIFVKESTVNCGRTEADRIESRRVHWEYMKRFGLGERSALEFPGESPGILKDYNDLWGSERATVSYGQGVASTPIQLVAAINAVANDGMYVAPRLVAATVGPDGTLTEADPSATHEVIRPEIAAEVQHMMRAVVCDPDGTGDRAQQGIENFSVAGKTGTGLKAQPNGTYLNEAGERSYYSSFVGFFPYEDPQVTVLVSIDEPPAGSEDRFGSTAAAPVFARLAPVIMHETGMVPPADTTSCDVFNTLPPGGV